MVLDMNAGPSWADTRADAPIIMDPDHRQYYRQPHFYAMAHFSKFLSPGSVRIYSSILSLTNHTNTTAGAFRTPHNSTVVIVVNNDETVIDFTLEDTKSGEMTAKIDPKSIQTFVYYD